MQFFHIENQPILEALSEISRRGKISIGGENLGACSNNKIRLVGFYSPEAAIKTALHDTNCDVRKIDAKTYVIVLKSPEIKKQHFMPNEHVETIVISGRRAQSRFQSPNSIQIIGKDQIIGNEGGLNEVSKYNAGFMVTNLGPGRNKILLRGLSDGVSTGNAQSIVSLYFDDAPITYNAPDPNLLLTDIYNIEVLKGPQGALYGEGPIAGIIKINSNKPQLDETFSQIGISNGFSSNAKVSSRLELLNNHVFAQDRFAIRSVVYGDYNPGYIKDIGISKSNINSSIRYGLRSAIRYKIDDNSAFDANFIYQNIDNKNSQYSDANLGKFTRNLPLEEPHDNDFNQFAAKYERNTKFGKVKINFNHIHHGISTDYSADSLASFFPQSPNSPIRYSEYRKADLSNLELSLISHDIGNLRYQIGIFGQNSEEIFRPKVERGQENLWNEDRDSVGNDFAILGGIQYIPNPIYDFSLNLRQNNNHHNLNGQISAPFSSKAQNFAYNNKQSTSHLSSQIAARLHLRENLMIYLQKSEGYRNGGFNTSYLEPQTPNIYEGDELNNLELGAKFHSLNRKLVLNTDIFNVNWDNILTNAFQLNGLPITSNVGNATITGFELDGTYQFDNSTKFAFSLAKNKAKLTNLKLNEKIEEYNLPNIPPFVLSATATKYIEWNKLPIELELTYQYTAKSSSNFAANLNADNGEFNNLSAKFTADLGATKFYMFFTNILNNKTNTLAFANPFLPVGFRQFTPPAPPNISIKLQRQF